MIVWSKPLSNEFELGHGRVADRPSVRYQVSWFEKKKNREQKKNPVVQTRAAMEIAERERQKGRMARGQIAA